MSMFKILQHVFGTVCRLGLGQGLALAHFSGYELSLVPVRIRPWRIFQDVSYILERFAGYECILCTFCKM